MDPNESTRKTHTPVTRLPYYLTSQGLTRESNQREIIH